MNFGFLKKIQVGNPIIDIFLPTHERYVNIKTIDPNTEEKITKSLPVFVGDDQVEGEIEIRLNNMNKLEHLGIKVELIGQIGTITC